MVSTVAFGQKVAKNPQPSLELLEEVYTQVIELNESLEKERRQRPQVTFCIDTHVHDRDRNQHPITTIAETMALALEQGVKWYGGMPNTSPLLNTRAELEARLALVPEERKNDYFTYMLIGSDDQHNREKLLASMQEVLQCYKDFRQVLGFKMYAGNSTANCGVPSNLHGEVYSFLTENNFDSVLVLHCEDDGCIHDDQYNPQEPTTHAILSRPAKAEIDSVKQQIEHTKRAKANGFKGKLLFAHISTAESIREIEKAIKEDGLDAYIEITPHHLLWNYDIMAGPDGAMYKMNPALRSPEQLAAYRHEVRRASQDSVLSRRIVLGTDHAPHSDEAKRGPKPPSGFPSLCLYKYTVAEFLPNMLGVSRGFVDEITYWNAQNLYAAKGTNLFN